MDAPQSALAPAGREAARIDELFWVMTIVFGIVWLAVVALAIYAYMSRREHAARTTRLVVIGGGVVLPIVTLTGFLVYGLSLLPSLLPSEEEAAVKIRVTGHQYWWRVRYVVDGREVFELANELHLPAGRRVEIELESRDVIHSFWIPSLGGKMDMIPGRTTRLALHPTRPGVYRGTCAEYCGTSHAWMSFVAVVDDEAAYERWFAAQQRPAVEPGGDARRGADEFSANGCGACHTIRGTGARGTIGPDLTHVGSRHSLAAGALANDPRGLRRWIAQTTARKPGVHMPAFGMLPAETLDALAVYLEGLQ